ncbi:hypothetical protein B0E46_06825 [Rhodanobacter sp. B04]|uniref:hypothetical protein n=1 Tax=Rhodanobacter sp. B04 TaxID=1945860 RepID=UPI0009850576|nr:hypothetical protein [Rhodanobacter sp. B04]OOG64373.1 hypothetical protein B0E46_06825 [Rhodanobacter sp. B04]
MSTKATVDADINKIGIAEATISPTGMHRPPHCALDTEETACFDEVQHEIALRESTLRAPR